MTLSRFVPLALAAVLLTGCSAGAGSAEPTESPSPSAASGGTALDAISAWDTCADAVDEWVATNSDIDPFESRDFDDAYVSEDAGTFRTQLAGDLGADDTTSVYCVVSGTVENPSIDDYLYPR